jgi:uncharacterized iron-regulated membrane protein
MSGTAIAITAVVVTVAVAVTIGLILWWVRRRDQREDELAAELAAERARTLDVQARELREAHLAKTRTMTDDELVAEAEAMAARFKADKERGR